jgi:hypothetical protein
VALHFLPLARLFNNPVYFVTTPAIILLDGIAVLREDPAEKAVPST